MPSHHLRRFHLPSKLRLASLAMVFAASGTAHAAVTFTTPGPDSWVVPAGITAVKVVATGGGGGAYADRGGNGGVVTVTLPVSPSDVLSLYVGGGGGGCSSGGGGGGGGSTTVDAGTAHQIIAGGGGGSGADSGGHGNGGDGGGWGGGYGGSDGIGGAAGFGSSATVGGNGNGGAGGIASCKSGTGASGLGSGTGIGGSTAPGTYFASGAGGGGHGGGGSAGSAAGGGGGGGSIGPSGAIYSVAANGATNYGGDGGNGSIVLDYSPIIGSVSPGHGAHAGGTVVTLAGANFTGVTSVRFGGKEAASFSVDSPTQITAVTPAGSTGSADITVTGAGGASTPVTAGQFVYDPPHIPTLGHSGLLLMSSLLALGAFRALRRPRI